MFETLRRWGNAAKKFLPHEFRQSVELVSGLPRVLVTREAYEDMFVLVDESPEEVGWLGSVRRLGPDFLIEEVFLFEQEVHGTTCEITPDGLAEMAQELISARPDGLDICNRLRFWGHSHHRMGTSPSGQDESQLQEFAEQDECEFFIRAILNKDGRMEFTILLSQLGVVVRDAAWELYEPADQARRERWRAEISKKVREKVVLPDHPTIAGVGYVVPDYRQKSDDGESRDHGGGWSKW